MIYSNSDEFSIAVLFVALHTYVSLLGVFLVAMVCFSADGSYINGDLRLVGGPFNWEGRVETFRNGTWGAISDSQWSTNDANVVCKQLKHSQESGEIIYCIIFHSNFSLSI